MPLDARVIYAALRIVGDGAAGKRETIGTGFLMSVNSAKDPNRRYAYVLTAAHVLDDHPGKIEVQLPDMNTNVLSEPIEVTDWRLPIKGLDLTLAPFSAQPPLLWAAIRLEQAMPDVREEPLRPLPGTQVYYVGILTQLDRTMVRSGTLGAIDQEGVPHRRKRVYTCHLVDCRSYGGFSGSPCFFEFEVPGLTPQPIPSSMDLGPFRARPYGRMGYYFPFCGMFTEHLTDEAPGIPSSRYGVGVMVRSEEIRQALMTDSLVEERRLMDERITPENGPRLESASTGPSLDEPSEFERFEELTRKLLHTPKPKPPEPTKET